jgi:hypothetical protein
MRKGAESLSKGPLARQAMLVNNVSMSAFSATLQAPALLMLVHWGRARRRTELGCCLRCACA